MVYVKGKENGKITTSTKLTTLDNSSSEVTMNGNVREMCSVNKGRCQHAPSKDLCCACKPLYDTMKHTKNATKNNEDVPKISSVKKNWKLKCFSLQNFIYLGWPALQTINGPRLGASMGAIYKWNINGLKC